MRGHSQASQDPAGSSAGSHIAIMLGAAMTLIPALVCAMTPHSPLPWWSADPSIMPPNLTLEEPGVGVGFLDAMLSSTGGFGPSATGVFAIVSLLGASLLLWLRPVPMIVTGLASLGSIGVILHAMFLRGGDVESFRVGASWLATVWGAVAIWSAGRDPAIRRMTIACALGALVLMTLRGAIQVFIEHPRTIEHFNQYKGTFFASRGWDPDSSAAQIYERRLNKGVATTWFALSNITAGFAAAGALGFGLLASAAIVARRWIETALMLASAIASLLLLALAGSTGGWGTLVLAGLGLGVLAIVRTRRPNMGGLVLLAIVMTPIIMVLARGALDPKAPETSLLIRSQYLQGTSAVVMDHPLAGVGPGGFRNAYTIRKPDSAPEDITSPHLIFADWLAMLGALGLGWIVLTFLAMRHAGPGEHEARCAGVTQEATPARIPSSPVSRPSPASLRIRIYTATAIIGLTIAISMYLARHESLLTSLAQTLDASDPPGAWAGPLALLIVLAFGALWASTVVIAGARHEKPGRIESLALLAPGITLLVHAQIDMTLMQPASAPLAGVLIGAALARAPGPASSSGSHQSNRFSPARSSACALTLTLACLLGWGLWGVGRWEADLARAAREIAPLATARGEIDRAIARGPIALREQIDRRGDVFPVGTPATPEDAMLRLAEARAAALPAVLPMLARANDHRGPFPRESLIREAMLHLALPSSAGEAGLERVRRIASRLLTRDPHDLGGLRVLAGYHGALGNEPDLVAVTARIAELDPTSVQPRLTLMRLAVRRGDPVEARRWASEALETSDRLWLDPALMLTDSERNEAQSVLSGP